MEKTEKTTESKRKRIVKRIAVIFLVTLLMLTFFSNTILNYSLPEVATAMVSEGSVSNKVRVQGTVEMSSDYSVTVSGSRVVKTVEVEAGDEVKAGQVLFTFEEGKNIELTEAQDALEQMEMNYAKSLLKLAPDYEDDNKNIKKAKEELKKAVADLEAAKEKNKDKKSADKAVEAAEDKVEAAEKKVEKQEEKIEKLQEKLDALQEKVNGYSELGDYDSVAAQLKENQKALAALELELADMKEDLKELEAAAKKEGAEGYADSIKASKRSIRDKETAISEMKETISKNEELLKKLEPVKAAKDDLKAAQNDLKTAQSDLKALNKALEDCRKKLQEKQDAASKFETTSSVEEAKAAVKEKQEALANLIDALADKKEQDALTEQSEAMDRQAAQKEIQKQKDKIAELERGDDHTEIKAKEDGIVATVSCKAGDTVSADTELAQIQSLNSNYLMKATVTKQQAALLRVGDEAKVENVWDRDLVGEVQSIKADTENPNQNMRVTFIIKGGAHPGETVQMLAGEKTARYETIVPNNAVKEDSSGNFVLVVTVKGTPLGNRYIVKRVEVSVEARDGSNSAVSGALQSWENVVTNSSKPLSSGMQVRLAD